MRVSNIQPVLEQLNVKIPLEIALADIPAWLETLTPEEMGQSSGKVLRLLKSEQIKGLGGGVAEFEVLGKIRATLDRLSLKLEKSLLDNGYPLPETAQINTELIICGYAELAQRLWQVAEYIVSPQDVGNAAHSVADTFIKGLEALRRALFYIALLYDHPYEGFWRLCYRFYRRAELLNILDTSITVNEGGYDSIANSFKNLLVFYLSDTSLLTQREMKALYVLFNNRSVPAKVYTELREDKAELLFGLSLQSDKPPEPLLHMEVRENEMRYFTTMKIARSAAQYLKGRHVKQDGLESGNYSLFLKIAKTLGMQASRNANRVAEKRTCQGLVGVNNVLRFMRLKNSSALAAAMQILPPQLTNASAAWSVPDMSLVPLGEEDLHRMKTSRRLAIERSEKLKRLFGDADMVKKPVNDDSEEAVRYEDIEIFDGSAKDYGILLKNPHAPVRIGDLIGVLNSREERVELGLVRRMTAAGKQQAELGVELISSQAGIGCIWRPSDAHDAQIVLLLPGIAALKQNDSIIYPAHAFGTGETIFIQQGENKVLCMLGKLLHTTNVFSLAELEPVDASFGCRA